MLPIRKGMWVVHNNSVGILVNFNVQAGTGEVHYVDKAGDTYAVNPEAQLLFLQQASLEQVPISRRADDTKMMGLGYMGERTGKDFADRIVEYKAAVPTPTPEVWYKSLNSRVRAIFTRGPK